MRKRKRETILKHRPGAEDGYTCCWFVSLLVGFFGLLKSQIPRVENVIHGVIFQ